MYMQFGKGLSAWELTNFDLCFRNQHGKSTKLHELQR